MPDFASHGLIALATEGARSLAILAVVVTIFAPLEAFFSLRKAKLFYAGWSVNLAWYFINAIVSVFLLGPPTILLAWLAHKLVPWRVSETVAVLPLWARIIAALAVGEIGFYWGHRLSHEVKWLWRFHAVHHSATHVNFLVNTRAHPIDIVFTRLCGLLLLYATGLTSVMGAHPTLIPPIVLFAGSMWSYFIHANIRVRLGPLEHIVATPAFHHWHHTYEDHKDRNYASLLPFADMLFGTYYLPATWPTRYGTETFVPETVVGQLVEPFSEG